MLKTLRRRLAAAPKPVGKFAYNDRDAAQVIYAARELGLDVECGFCNIAYLSNVFRKATGLSPRAWSKSFAHTPTR